MRPKCNGVKEDDVQCVWLELFDLAAAKSLAVVC
jgi:hypothetical protein